MNKDIDKEIIKAVCLSIFLIVLMSFVGYFCGYHDGKRTRILNDDQRNYDCNNDPSFPFESFEFNKEVAEADLTNNTTNSYLVFVEDNSDPIILKGKSFLLLVKKFK